MLTLIPPISVSEFLGQIREVLETGYPDCWITGEISQVRKAPSGHLYFSIKDKSSSVRAVMWRGKAFSFQSLIKEGAQVDVLARPSLYEPRGEFQLQVDAVRTTGMGVLYQRFVELKERLSQEGLFDEIRKKPIPTWPQRIGIITSLQAAALADVLTAFKRRNPTIALVIYPTAVQGERARETIIEQIQAANRRQECDALILCRGGGSFDDLHLFNDESIARAIAASDLPLVTGIGHETDITIADYVADYRAPTPTAAAEFLSPLLSDALEELEDLYDRLRQSMIALCHRHDNQLDRLMLRLISPETKIAQQQHRLKNRTHDMKRLMDRRVYQAFSTYRLLVDRLHRQKPAEFFVEKRLHQLIQLMKNDMRLKAFSQQARLEKYQKALMALNPFSVLSRGYSITYDEQGKIIYQIDQVRPHQRIITALSDGQIESVVISSSPTETDETAPTN